MTAQREVGWEAAYHEDVYALEAGNFWFRARNELIAWALETGHGTGPGRYLEIGCGTGYVLAMVEERFPALTLAGSEALESGLALARRRVQRTELLALDARDLPYEATFDVVGAFDVLEHIAEDGLALQQIARALRPGGKLVLTVPQHPWLWSPGDDYARHERRYTRAELAGKLVAAGFVLERVTSFVGVLLPLMAASRVVQRLRPKAYDPHAEYALSPRLNRLFERALAVERGWIRRGHDLPAGGSLLAIARKP